MRRVLQSCFEQIRIPNTATLVVYTKRTIIIIIIAGRRSNQLAGISSFKTLKRDVANIIHGDAFAKAFVKPKIS